MSPFVALYGHEPRHWGLDAASTCSAPSLQDWLTQLNFMQQVLQHNLHHARQYMKTLADKKRTDQTFDVGDEMFIKLQPNVQFSTVQRSNHKLSLRYFGPDSIIKKINPVAYEVKLPETSKIHHVFHVSQLRRVLKSGMHASTQLPF
jgi:hypothetical protein